MYGSCFLMVGAHEFELITPGEAKERIKQASDIFPLREKISDFVRALFWLVRAHEFEI